jgi:hypothetical protein
MQDWAEAFILAAVIVAFIVWYVLGFLKFLPDDLSDKIVNKFLGMLGL